MKPIEQIRREVFSVTQAEFAGLAGVTQATVARWESGELSPRQEHMQAIRREAKRRRLKLRDSMFFEGKESAA